MRDKSMCWKCKYHTYMGNLPANKIAKGYSSLSEGEKANIACFYSVVTRSSALKPNGAKAVIDTRGEEPGCKLFVEGVRDREKAKHDFTNDEGLRRGVIKP